MKRTTPVSKATRQLRMSGLPLARAAVHVGRRKRKSPGLRAMIMVGCMALLGGGAAIAMVALKPTAQAVAAVPEPLAAPEITVAAAVVPVAATATPTPQTTPFASRRATDNTTLAAADVDTATVLSNLQAVVQQTTAEPDCRTTLNAVAQQMNVTFGISSNALDPAAATALDVLATRAAACEGVQIVVAGHSDTTGSPEANMALSWQRADEVVAAIVGMGHDPKLFNAVGYGARNPVMVNGVVDEAASRRVEFLVTMADAPTTDEVMQ